MKNLNLKNYSLEEINNQELANIDGGGKWSWGEAGLCFVLGGAVGVGFYYLGTRQ